MDITPQELRDIEIRESFRGYHRDDVDDLLERAASTIEHLEHQIRVLQERLASAPAATRREPTRHPLRRPRRRRPRYRCRRGRRAPATSSSAR